MLRSETGIVKMCLNAMELNVVVIHPFIFFELLVSGAHSGWEEGDE